MSRATAGGRSNHLRFEGIAILPARLQSQCHGQNHYMSWLGDDPDTMNRCIAQRTTVADHNSGE